jgi:ABC-type nitrate/sulfonate/bicarbonate transport system permease component
MLVFLDDGFGIGAYILTAGALFATDQLICGVAILAVIGIMIGWLIGYAERQLLKWRD